MQHTDTDIRAIARELVLEQFERLLSNNFFLEVLEDDWLYLGYEDICRVVEELRDAKVKVSW